MTDKPNIVYIAADQWRGDCLGLYGNQHPVMTPHINQLAAEGTLFTRAYADCPICMPQRVTMLTGQTASQLQCLTNFRQRPDFDLDRSLPARLRNEAGYQTKAIGKMHFAPSRSRYGFEHVSLHPDDYLWWLEDHGYGGTFRGHGLGGNEVYPTVSTMPEPFYHSSWIVDQAVRYLDQLDPEMPFFLYMVFEAPHSPFDPPQPYDRMYDNFTIADPCRGDWCDNNPVTMYERNIKSRKFDELSDDAVREARRRYYGQISQIDYRLGLLFGALRSKGLDSNTIIVFTADHGESLGDHGIFAKHTFLESAARVPLVLRLGQSCETKLAAENNTPVLTADICPTLLELAGLQPDNEPEGKSLLAADSDKFAQRTIFGETPDSACAICGQMKYIWYAAGGVEHLFNIESDGDDLCDLSERPEMQETVKSLRQKLIAYLANNGSPKVSGGQLTASDSSYDALATRRVNPFACRGPMRGGDGY